MRLLPHYIIHRHHAAKVPRTFPALKRISKFLPRPPGKKVQFKSTRPPLHLLRRNQHLFPPHIPGPSIEIPVKLLKRVARLLVCCRPAQFRRPVRDHAPVVVISRLTLPFIKLRPGHAFPGQKSHRLQRRAPKTLAHVHQNTIHIKNQNLRNRVKSFASSQCRQISSPRLVDAEYRSYFDSNGSASLLPVSNQSGNSCYQPSSSISSQVLLRSARSPAHA